VWVRFLETACGKTVWTATHADVDAFHRARRRDDVDSRISAASWNRSIAVLDKLYSWAQSEGLVATSPFRHRHVWRQGHGTARARILARNQSYERAAKRSDLRFISLEDYRVFRDVGLRGLMADGAERPGGKDRNGTRNALFAELLVTTGLRLSEASFLLAVEIADLARQAARGRQSRFELPCALTKGERGRSVFLPQRLLQQIASYIAAERALAVAKFKHREAWNTIEQPIFIRRPEPRSSALVLRDGGTIPFAALTPDERGRLVICGNDGAANEPAALWLTEIGLPVQPNSWEAAFCPGIVPMLRRRLFGPGQSSPAPAHLRGAYAGYADSTSLPRERW